MTSKKYNKKWIILTVVTFLILNFMLPVVLQANEMSGEEETTSQVVNETETSESVVEVENDAEEETSSIEEEITSEVQTTSEETSISKEEVTSKEETSSEAESTSEEEAEVKSVVYVDPMLDGFSATEHPAGDFITYYEKGSLGSATSSSSRARALQLVNGDVTTSKTATAVPGMVNTWDIKVRVEAADFEVPETTDIVLVIDRSGSMEGTKMADTKTAAKNFVSNVLTDDPNVRIAIVSFSSNYSDDGQTSVVVTTNSTFRNRDGIPQLNSAIDSLVAFGGTHTQAAIVQASQLINGSQANNKYMILLSDGQPTYSYRPNTISTTSSGSFSNWLYTRYVYNAIYDGNYNPNITVGNGSAMTSYYGINGPRGGTETWQIVSNPQSNLGSYNRFYYIHNGQAAVRQATTAKTSLDTLYTIAVAAGDQGTPILDAIASPGKSFNTENSAELNTIYDEIAQEVQMRPGIRDGVIVDEMGDGFTLLESTITTSQGTTVTTTPTGNNQTITWDLGDAVTELIDGSTNTRYAEMTYRVEINPDLLDIPGATTDDTQLFDTNKVTNLTYRDLNNTTQSIDITSPEVDPVLMKVRKILLDENGDEITGNTTSFDVHVNDAGSTFNKTYSVLGGTGYTWSTELRYEDVYTVSETYNSSYYTVNYMVDGVEADTFQVYHTEGIPRGDVTIDVTNQVIPQTIDFSFTKTGEDGTPLTGAEFTLTRDSDGAVITNTGTDPEFIFADLTVGMYTLTETKAPPGYNLPTKTWTIEVVRDADTDLLSIVIPDDSFLTGTLTDGFEMGNKESEFPQTGGFGGLLYALAGTAILSTSMFVLVKKNKKGEKHND